MFQASVTGASGDMHHATPASTRCGESEIVAADRAPIARAAFPVEVRQREGHGTERIGQRQVHLLVGGGREIDRTPCRRREISGRQGHYGLYAGSGFPDAAPDIAADDVCAARNFHAALRLLCAYVHGKHCRQCGNQNYDPAFHVFVHFFEFFHRRILFLLSDGAT